ncbi:MAG: transporter substrate-binding domain-containing protein, partial [Pseudohongiellaceae bacterium]
MNRVDRSRWKWFCGALVTSLLGAMAIAEPTRVLTEHSPPGEYLDEDGRVTGATAEMVRELMQRAGEPGDIALLPWARAYNIALRGPNVALFETTRTATREDQFKWVGPVKRIVKGLYTRRVGGVELSSLDEARQLDGICAYLGGSAGQALLEAGFTNLEQPTRPAQCLEMLMYGRVDAWITSDIGHVALFAESDFQETDAIPAYIMDTQYLYIAFSLDTPDSTVARWQQTLDQMKRDGSFARYYRG